MSTDQVNNSSEINIEKLDYEVFIKEERAYTSICNEAAQNVRDPIALAMWVFLQTLPPTWIPNKAHIMKHFKIGENRYTRHIAYLKKCNLVDYYRPRHKNGTLGKVTLHVLSGRKFKLPDNVVSFTANKKSQETCGFNHSHENHSSGESVDKSSHSYESHGDGNHGHGFEVHINTTSFINSTGTDSINRLATRLNQEEAKLKKLLKAKIGVKMIASKQIKLMLARAKFGEIEKSLAYYLLSEKFKQARNKFSYFYTCIINDGYFPDCTAYTEDETKPQEQPAPLDASHIPYRSSCKALGEEIIESRQKGVTMMSDLLEALRKRNSL